MHWRCIALKVMQFTRARMLFMTLVVDNLDLILSFLFAFHVNVYEFVYYATNVAFRFVVRRLVFRRRRRCSFLFFFLIKKVCVQL